MKMFTRSDLKAWAGSAAYGRGEAYYSNGRVDDLGFYPNSVQAEVSGTHDYEVHLKWWRKRMAYSCDCPVGEQGDFCKHCVAVGLAWLERIAGTSAKKRDTPASDDARLRRWLEGKEPDELVAVVMEMAGRHRNVEKELLLRVAAGSTDLKVLKQTIRKVIGSGNVDYYEMPAYGRRIAAVSELLEQMLVDDHANEVQPLALYAVDRMKAAYNNMDDSDGIAGSEMAFWQELHLKAYEAVPPANAKARVVLARELFERELNSDWGEFHGAVAIYADVLGTEGVAEYQQLIEAEWEKLPELAPGDKEQSFDGNRWKISSMMESLARASGDVDELIRTKSHDLSSGYDFLQIAKICSEAERHDEALAWAKKGVVAFADQPDTRLEEFLAEEYVRRKQFDKAVALAWTMFERSPDLSAWQRLKQHAIRVKAWNKWKACALDHVRDKIAREMKKSVSSHYFKPNHSLLVEIFLFEKEFEAAWNEAQKGGCNPALWRKLGSGLADYNPARAANCWLRLVEPTIDLKSNKAYDDAVDIMVSIRQWMQKAGQEQAFTHLLVDIRMRHKAKRNLMQRMNEQNMGGHP